MSEEKVEVGGRAPTPLDIDPNGVDRFEAIRQVARQLGVPRAALTRNGRARVHTPEEIAALNTDPPDWLVEERRRWNDELERQKRFAANRSSKKNRTLSQMRPAGGKIDRYADTSPVVAATDASYDARSNSPLVSGHGYVTSNGCWGMRHWRITGHSPDKQTQFKTGLAELRAVALLMVEHKVVPDVLLTDSMHAVEFLAAWRAGDVRRVPEGYPLDGRSKGRGPTLLRLAQVVWSAPGLEVCHVKGHSGHVLNEAVDSLASIARRNPRGAELHAAHLVEGFLDQWHNV